MWYEKFDPVALRAFALELFLESLGYKSSQIVLQRNEHTLVVLAKVRGLEIPLISYVTDLDERKREAMNSEIGRELTGTNDEIKKKAKALLNMRGFRADLKSSIEKLRSMGLQQGGIKAIDPSLN